MSQTNSFTHSVKLLEAAPGISDTSSVNWTTPDAYCDLFDRLERNNVPYVVVSGVAVVLHGHVRPVVDLDIVIAATPHESHRAMQTLTEAGFVPSIPLPLSMVTVLRMFDPKQREVDVFVRYHIPFNELWASSEQKLVRKSVVRIMSMEHLLRAKRITGRPHDLRDIEGLLALQGSGDGSTSFATSVGEPDESV